MKFSSVRLILATIALASVAYAIVEFQGPNGYRGLMNRRAEVLRLERENQRMREQIDRLDKRVDKLTHDPMAQELEIRKRLGLVKQGETVYVLQEKSSRSSTSTQ